MVGVAVACPGPSLATTWPGWEWIYSRVWAVNRAAAQVLADWFVLTDPCFFDPESPAYVPWRPILGTLSGEGSLHHVRHKPEYGLAESWWDCDWINEHQKARPVQWSVQAALIHAARKTGVSAIDLHGATMAGREDITGYVGEDRSESRWFREAADLAFTTEFLARKGVTVRRILPP